MKNILKIELKRAFCNKRFMLSLLIGCIICVMHVILNVAPMANFNLKFQAMNMPPHSVFNKWIGAGYNFWSGLYFTVFPLLASIPFADSFFSDYKSGYIMNIITRTKKKHYLMAKAIAVFLCAGVTVVLPLLLNLYLSAMILPSIAPDSAVGTYPLLSNSTWASIFYSNAYLYVFIYLILIFIVSGLLVTLSLVFSYMINNAYIVLLTPFLCFIGISFISLITSIGALDITLWISPTQTIPANIPLIISLILIVVAVLVIGFYLRGKHKEFLNEK